MREAVTAALIHDGHILAVRRQPYLKVFPGYLAFPGGKIDQQDEGYEFSHPLVSGFPSSQIQALCRELTEEIGFDLIDALAAGEVSSVSLFGTSVTPAFDRYRFRVHHFKILLERRPEIHADRDEIAWSGWVQADQLMRRYDRGEELMVIPTRNIIRALAGDIGVERIAPLNLEYDQERELPLLELIRGVGIIPVPSMTLPPARYTNALVVGDPGHPRCLIDPSPESDQVCGRLLHTLRDHPVDTLLITHHHPDHHQYAPQIARALRLPLLCSARTERRLAAVYGADYLDAVPVRHVSDGEPVTRWLGRSVLCHELPGHDDGMLGLRRTISPGSWSATLSRPWAAWSFPSRKGRCRPTSIPCSALSR